MTLDLERYARDPVAFIDRFIQRNELGQPFRLLPHQREILQAAFQFDEHDRLPWDTIVFSAVKKSGKTTVDSAVTTWWAFTQEPPNDVKLCANDQEQSVSRTFTTIRGLLKHNPELGVCADVKAQSISFSNGTTIAALACDYAGEAGANQGWSSWTELWAYTSESSRRLWEELTPVPTRRNSIRFVDTCAGFEGESELLRSLYLQGVGTDEHPDGQGERIHPDLPIYANRDARLFVYWDHEPRMPWQTAVYYDAQRRQLRPATYIRLHENRWTTAESVFLTPELYDPCVVLPGPVLADPSLSVVVGCDAALKHDTAAVVVVAWNGTKLQLVTHTLWNPTPASPLDLESTIEAEIRRLRQRFSIRKVVCDPWQMARSTATLKAAGLPMEEFPQTQSNLTAMAENLYDLLKGKNLQLYPDADLRQQALNTTTIETPRGFRITKERASRKIDLVIALGMACQAAVQMGKPSLTAAVILADSGPPGWRQQFFR